MLTRAAGGGSGGVWRKDSVTGSSSAAWAHVGKELDAPYSVIDAAMDPTDSDHLYAIIPRTKSSFGLYESTDGGESWRRDREFAESFRLVDDKSGWKSLGRGAAVEMFDNGNVFVYNYQDTPAPDTADGSMLHLQGLANRGSESVVRSVDLSGESDVEISYWEYGGSFDGKYEDVEVQFYTGRRWREVASGGPDAFGWRERTFDVPDDWLSSDNRIRLVFEFGQLTTDHWYVDNLTVSSSSGTVLTEDWEAGSLADWSTTGDVDVRPPDDWVYYSTNGGASWRAGEINVTAPRRPGAKSGQHYANNRLSFATTGNGVLNPTGKVLYVTRDYGRTWTRLGNYSSANALTHAVANDGTVHVAYNRNNITFLDTYAPGTTGSPTTRNLSAPLPRREEGPALCKYCPQVMAVEPGDPSHIVVLTYVSGPYETRDGGRTWDKLFNNNKTLTGLHPLIQRRELQKGDAPTPIMPRPDDYRDVEMLDEVGRSGDVLIGSDQGLYVMDTPDSAGGKVKLTNVAGTMDHSEVYNVEVDACGNLYHGLWHQSAMIRTPLTNPRVTERWETRQAYQERGRFRRPLQLRYRMYYFGGGESGRMFLKDRDDCLSWASNGRVPWSPPKFSPYATDSSGTLQKQTTSGPEVLNVTGRPVFFGGRWHYLESNTSSLVSTTLSSGGRTVEATNVSNLVEDGDPAGSASEALWFANRSAPVLQRFRGQSQSSRLTTGVDLRGSRFGLKRSRWDDIRFDVADGRVAAVVTGPTEEDILIYDTATTPEPVRADDLGSLSNPFGDATIMEVFVDPTDDERYFATIKNPDDAQCPFHLMVTEDGGDTWRQFSEELDCHVVWDLAFDEGAERVYAATHGRGVLRGNLTELNRPGRGNLAVNVSCGDTRVTETDVVNCTVAFSSSGDVSEWRGRPLEPELLIDPPYRTLEYALPEFLDPATTPSWEAAGCAVRAIDEAVDGVRQNGLRCTDPLREFPPSGTVDVRIELRKRLVAEDPARGNVTARLNFTNASPDTFPGDDSDTETLAVHALPSRADRFDFATDRSGEVVTRNDGIGNATRIGVGDWDHGPTQHFACPDDPDYEGGDEIVQRLRAQGETCAGVVTNGSEGAPLSGVEIYTTNVTQLGLGVHEDFFNVTMPGAESPVRTPDTPAGTPSPAGPPCGSYEETLVRRTDGTGTFLFTLSSTYRQYFRAPDRGPNRDVAPELRRAFDRNGVNLSGKAFIRLPDGTTDWDAGSWVVVDAGEWLVVEQPDGSLKVYRRNRSETIENVNVTVETHSRVIIMVTGTDIPIADDDAPPDARLIPLNATKLRPAAYTDAGAGRNLTVTRDAGANTLTATVECPQEEGLGHLILALGESGRVGGGYNLSLAYRRNYTRGAARYAIGDIDLGQYDEFGVAFNGTEGWYERPIDVEELKEEIIASEIGVDPDPTPGDPPPGTRVSVASFDAPTGEVPPLDRVLAADGSHPYVFVDPGEEFAGRTRLTVAVSEDLLDRRGLAAEQVALYRYAGPATGWTELDTERLGATDAGISYRAEANGSGLFAVGSVPSRDVGPTLRIVPAERTVAPESNATVEVVLENVDAGVTAYDLTLTVGNGSVARLVSAADATGGTARVELTSDGRGAEFAVVGGETPRRGPVTLARATVGGVAPGETRLELASEGISNATNFPYRLAATEGATLRVAAERGPPPVCPDGRAPTDPDEDGVYEDLDGDGTFDVFDVQCMLERFGDPAVQDNVAAFDVTDDGSVDVFDVQALLEEL